MRFGEIIASFLIHAALLGTAAWFYSPPPAPQESVPIVFELIEESSLSSQRGSVPTQEATGTDPEIASETLGTDPEIAGTDPEEEKEELGESGEIANKSDDIERARVVSDPVALNRITPVYPRSARRKGHEGCVTVELSVSESGEVSSVEIVSSSGHEELDASALGAVRTARFAPATEDGESVCGRVRLTFDFRLR